MVPGDAAVARGTYTLETSQYFTISKQPTALRARLLPKWKSAAGKQEQSKHVQPSDFGESADNPVRSRLVLQAWTIYRMRLRGFCSRKPARARWVELQVRDLQEKIRSLGCADGGTGCSRADGLISMWALRDGRV